MAEPSILGALRDPQFRSDTLRNLVEALNGAKRSLTVGSLGAVGDMGNTLANLVRAGAGTAYHEATGRPIPQALEYRDPARDFGTSASLGNFAERQGWLPPQTHSLPEQAGALLGPIAAMKAPDLAQSTLRGLVSALKSEPSRRMVEGYMGGMGMKPQAIVWHGSPHTFDAFDSSKIGTGEGAQAYGHGLYLAEAPSVADQYRINLAYDPDQMKVGGRQINDYYSTLQDKAARLPIQQANLEYEKLDLLERLMSNETLDDVQKATVGMSKPTQDWFAKQVRPSFESFGSLYKVDLPDPLIARMLDWDKPLSQQAPEVSKSLRSLVSDVTSGGFDLSRAPRNVRNAFDANAMQAAEAALSAKYGAIKTAAGWLDKSGRPIPQDAVDQMLAKLGGKSYETAGQLYNDLTHITGSQADISATLRNNGIPGIRYLDGGSRADGAGTSNFVVFPGEESALTILERNGKPVRK